MNTDLRPEDFWPDAEKLLDKHYKAKRRRRAILWFITALTIIGASLYFNSDRHSNSIAVSETENQIKTEIKNNSIEIPSNIKNENPVSQNNEVKNNTSSNNISGTNNTSTNKNENITKTNSHLNSKTNSNNNSQYSNTNKKIKSPAKTAVEKPALKSTAIAGTSLAISTTNSTPVKKDLETKLPETNSKSNELNTKTTSTISVENSVVASLNSPLFEELKIEKRAIQPAAIRNSKIEEPKISGSAEYRFDVLAGANLISKNISGYSNSLTESKREAGEKNVVTPQLSLEVSRVTEKYSIALGLNYIQYGEKVNYDPTVNTKIAIDNSYWNTYTTNVLDTDTNYVYGFVYFSQQMVQRLDSNYVSQTDSVDQTVINQNIQKSKGTNVISYVEIPVSVSYYFGKKKFKYGVSAGISAGLLVYSNGYYLNNAGTDVINISDEKFFRKIIFNGQVGLDFRYCLSPKTHLLFRPQYRMNLDSILKDQDGPSQKYSAFGVSAGVSFLIK